MTKLTLYDFPESGNSYKIRLILHLLDIACNIVPMKGFEGATRTGEFKEKNVDERLPCLELADGTCLAESNAILHYLAHDTRLSSDKPVEQAEILRWMFFEQNRIEATVGVNRFMQMYAKQEKRNPGFERVNHKRALSALQVMDDHLADHDFFACKRFTIADIALYAYTHVAGEADFELSQFPNIQSWIKRIEGIERFIPFLER